MDEDRILGLLGLAIRAGKARSGAEVAEQAIRNGKAKLLVYDAAISSASKKVWLALCEKHGVKSLMLAEHNAVERMTGKSMRKVLVILDQGFANMIDKAIPKNQMSRGANAQDE